MMARLKQMKTKQAWHELYPVSDDD